MIKSDSIFWSAGGRRRVSRFRAGRILWTAGPAALVGVLEIPAILWAHWTFRELRPDYVAQQPATVSRAISTEAIGAVFANVVLVIAVLVCLSVWQIVRAYLATIDAAPLDARQRKSLVAKVYGCAVLQAVGLAGIVLATQFTFANSHDMHMFGSYLLFIGQTASIGLSGLICRRLACARSCGATTVRQPFTLLPAMQVFRARFAAVIVAMALAYLVLFVAKDLVASRYMILAVFTTVEVLVLAAFVLYLAAFVPDLVAIARDRDRPVSG